MIFFSIDDFPSEEKEVELMEKMLSSLHNHQVERRSTDGPTDVDVEEIFRKPVDCLKMEIMSAWQRLLKQ